jgi:hypothetical protein
MPSNYIWPLSKSSIPSDMNTSFGPRINTNRWDFHDSIDLPAEKGTKIYAMRGGKVHFAGEPGAGKYDSRHVILEVDDPNDGLMYLVHLHLDSVDGAVTSGTNVVQGQEIGTVGDHKATYPHLHIEFLQGTPDTDAQTSRHPLRYLPYSDTANFTASVADRFNRLGPLMAARLLFGACNKSEGDLLKVEVDLLSGTQLLTTRVVDFHNKTTINKKRGNSDKKIFKNDIGVEGYQKSPMNDPERPRNDLKYGILVRNIPDECDTLVARVVDVGGNSVRVAGRRLRTTPPPAAAVREACAASTLPRQRPAHNAQASSSRYPRVASSGSPKAGSTRRCWIWLRIMRIMKLNRSNCFVSRAATS